MLQMFQSSLGFDAFSPQSGYLQQTLTNLFKQPYFGTPVEHFKAELVAAESFDKYGKPDWMAQESGQYDSGIKFAPNPDNPLRGVYCRAPLRPNQEPAGITLQAEVDLYLPVDPGDVFVLHDDRPKLQDKFVIQGNVFYATAPVFPCQVGEAVALWKVSLSRERYPVRLESGV